MKKSRPLLPRCASSLFRRCHTNAPALSPTRTARSPFGGIPHRDPSHFNALLAARVRANDPAAALHLFHRVRSDSGLRLDSYTFTPVLTACAAFPHSTPVLGRQLHALMLITGCHSESIPATALLDLYSKCGHLNDAVSVFGEMPVKDVVAWNALLSCYIRHSLAGAAVTAFRSMVKHGVEFTGFTLCTMLKVCTSSGTLRVGRQIHAQVIVTGCASLVTGTGLVDFYSSCGAVRDAVIVFNGMNCGKDVAIYNALASGCVRSRLYKVAFSLIGEVKPNDITLTIALSACSETLDLPRGKQIHSVIIRNGFTCDVILNNALIDMYAKCGVITAAHRVFDRIGEKNVVSWTCIIDAYGNHGHGFEALKLFNKMEEEESKYVSPNAVTLLSVLSACAHSGLVDEGRSVFFSMRDKYGLDPGPEHYSCFIDLLGRAGRMDEAWDLFSGMTAKSDKLTTGVCVSMLNACRISMDKVRGEHVVKVLMELDPHNPGSFVLVSNFFAAVGIWNEVEDVRQVMSSRTLKKQVGNSHIAIKGCC